MGAYGLRRSIVAGLRYTRSTREIAHARSPMEPTINRFAGDASRRAGRNRDKVQFPTFAKHGTWRTCPKGGNMYQAFECQDSFPVRGDLMACALWFASAPPERRDCGAERRPRLGTYGHRSREADHHFAPYSGGPDGIYFENHRGPWKHFRFQGTKTV